MSTEVNKHGRPEEAAQQANENRHTIKVTVDDKPKDIRPGNRLVSEFKEEVGVDASLALDQVVDGVFKPLEDSNRIHPKGGEIFVSHVRTGGSS
jgi:hypothetical protein